MSVEIHGYSNWEVSGATADDGHVGLRNGLRTITPTREDYATAPIADGFDWERALTEAYPGRWYVVAFRSRLKPGADVARLAAHDRAALEEALSQAPGLLVYFAGGQADDGSCLSFCVWTSERHARNARLAPRHREAVAVAGAMYESFQLETGTLTKEPDGNIRIELHVTVPGSAAHA